MDNELADAIVGIMMVPLGLLGLLLASRAEDAEMYLFGLSLAGFALAFGFGVLRVHLDRTTAVHVRVAEAGSDD